jgi:hypothetical protein
MVLQASTNTLNSCPWLTRLALVFIVNYTMEMDMEMKWRFPEIIGNISVDE